MDILGVQFPFDISDEINRVIAHDKNELELKKKGKIHTAMNYILHNSYVEDLFEEYFLLNSYTAIHGYDEYGWSLIEEFRLVNDQVNKELKLDCYEYWKQFYIGTYKKIERLKKRIEKMIDNSDDRYIVFFVTIKPDDRYYLSPETVNRENYTDFRTKVRKFVKEYSDFYVLNKDFGLNETRRLHFHGCVQMSKGLQPCFIRNCEKKFGFCTAIPIDKRSDLLSRYISKLSKHAFKVNYGFNRENLIYSRGNL